MITANAGAFRNCSTSDLLDHVQKATISYFWDGAHPVSGLACDRRLTSGEPRNQIVSIGGSGFSYLAIIVGVSRGWIDRAEATYRLSRMTEFLDGIIRFHGAYSHFVNGETGAVIPFSRYDDGGDLVETALLAQGMICAREFFDGDSKAESLLRFRIQRILDGIEWHWYTKCSSKALFWHWSAKHHWKMNLPITGWNEGMVAYILAAGSSTYPIDEHAFHQGWARNGQILNGATYYGHSLPLGPAYGGPLMFAHASFSVLDPRRMRDRYCAYWQQNHAHAMINYSHCLRNPSRHTGYGPDCWGLTASHGPDRFVASAPDNDLGIIAPTAALSSFPYLPQQADRAMRHFFEFADGRLWGRYGFVDAFHASGRWISKTYLAINQGPIIAMIENYRSQLLWNLFMSAPEIHIGLARADITVVKCQEPASNSDH